MTNRPNHSNRAIGKNRFHRRRPYWHYCKQLKKFDSRCWSKYSRLNPIQRNNSAAKPVFFASQNDEDPFTCCKAKNENLAELKQTNELFVDSGCSNRINFKLIVVKGGSVGRLWVRWFYFGGSAKLIQIIYHAALSSKREDVLRKWVCAAAHMCHFSKIYRRQFTVECWQDAKLMITERQKGSMLTTGVSKAEMEAEIISN